MSCRSSIDQCEITGNTWVIFTATGTLIEFSAASKGCHSSSNNAEAKRQFNLDKRNANACLFAWLFNKKNYKVLIWFLRNKYIAFKQYYSPQSWTVAELIQLLMFFDR